MYRQYVWAVRVSFCIDLVLRHFEKLSFRVIECIGRVVAAPSLNLKHLRYRLAYMGIAYLYTKAGKQLL